MAQTPQPQLQTHATGAATTQQLPAWQQVYRQLKLSEIKGVTSYQVNNNLFIVVPLADQ